MTSLPMQPTSRARSSLTSAQMRLDTHRASMPLTSCEYGGCICAASICDWMVPMGSKSDGGGDGAGYAGQRGGVP